VLLGRWGRRLALGPLHGSPAPIWGIGSWAVDAYRAEFGPGRAYANVPYFSNLDRFLLTAPQPGTREFTFLYSGSLVYRKGVDLLARAFARLAQEMPTVRLRIMGQGALEADLRRTLAAHASRVDWVGFKDWRELPGEYAASQVLCAPSRHDGWGLVVPEGLAAGLPVIGTDRTGAAIDLIEPGANGWRIPAGSEDALLDAMRIAAGLTAGSWLAMSERARARVSTHSLADGTMRFLAAAAAAADTWRVRS
jgi:glycosyltransferase involved in cell wall biosynthesis